MALGNYMNSSKRGAVYGFKLQSLDLVTHTHARTHTQTHTPAQKLTFSVSVELVAASHQSTDAKEN